MVNNVYPRSFSHIGLSVTDLEGAVRFYTEVMGWYLVMPPTTIEEDENLLKVLQAKKGGGVDAEEILAVKFRIEKKKLLQEAINKV